VLFLFSKALLKINLGVAYAAWIGVGIVLIIAGCLLLNLLSSVHPPNSPDKMSGLFGEI
jgi:multidrug transporter EmrE-like cation transporter